MHRQHPCELTEQLAVFVLVLGGGLGQHISVGLKRTSINWVDEKNLTREVQHRVPSNGTELFEGATRQPREIALPLGDHRLEFPLLINQCEQGSPFGKDTGEKCPESRYEIRSHARTKDLNELLPCVTQLVGLTKENNLGALLPAFG